METLEQYLAKVQKIRGQDPRQESDYDWEAAFKDGYVPEAGHGTDKYKRPNHPTFSNESMYHGQNGNEGGQWQEVKPGLWNFAPGKTNLNYHRTEDLQKYFDDNEPDATLILPKGGAK